MVNIGNMGNNNFGFIPVVDQPSDGTTVQRFGVNGVKLLPLGGTTIRVDPIHQNEFGFSYGHPDAFLGPGIWASFELRLWIRSSLRPKVPLLCSSQCVTHSGLSLRGKPSFASVESVLRKVQPFSISPFRSRTCGFKGLSYHYRQEEIFMKLKLLLAVAFVAGVLVGLSLSRPVRVHAQARARNALSISKSKGSSSVLIPLSDSEVIGFSCVPAPGESLRNPGGVYEYSGGADCFVLSR